MIVYISYEHRLQIGATVQMEMNGCCCFQTFTKLMKDCFVLICVVLCLRKFGIENNYNREIPIR